MLVFFNYKFPVILSLHMCKLMSFKDYVEL